MIDFLSKHFLESFIPSEELSTKGKELSRRGTGNEGLVESVCLPIRFHLLNRQTALMMDLSSPSDLKEKRKKTFNLSYRRNCLRPNFLDQIPFSVYEVGTFFVSFASEKVVPS